jgi:serpin B
VFDSAWETKYDDKDCTSETFYAYDGTKSSVKLMKSTEQYIYGKGFTGFTKNYANGYKFVAVLPDEKTDVFDFVSQTSYRDVYNRIMEEVYFGEATAYIPAFEYDYDIELNDALIKMGLADAFSEAEADFSGIDSRNNLYIDKVLHNTHIEVKQEGTKAAAATAVIIDRKSATPIVKLDRPFVYYIIDEKTSLPVFMGIVTEVK